MTADNNHFFLQKDETLEDLIKNQLEIYTEIFSLKYFAFILYNPFDKQKNTIIQNNPKNFFETFNTELIDYDFLLTNMMNYMLPVRLNDFQLISREQKLFYNECQKLRPAGDCCYAPLFFDSTFNGFMGFSKNTMNDRFSDHEIGLLKKLNKSLNEMLNIRVMEDYYKSIPSDSNDIFIGSFFLNNERRHITDISYEVFHVIKHFFSGKADSNQSLKVDSIMNENFYSFIAQNKKFFTFIFNGYTYSIFKTTKYSDNTQITFENYFSGYSVYRSLSFHLPYYLESNMNNTCLTGMEKRIISSVFSGQSNSDISRNLRISPETVKKHLSNIYEKLGVKSRTQLIFKILNG